MRTPPPSVTSDRRAPRYAKAIRFSFEYAGREELAVTTSVSLSGAYLKASVVPETGSMLALRERYATGAAGVVARGEVVWARPAVTLERPEPGFGFQFTEIVTQGVADQLMGFLKELDPNCPASLRGAIASELRADGTYSILRTFSPEGEEESLDWEEEIAVHDAELEGIDIATAIEHWQEETSDGGGMGSQRRARGQDARIQVETEDLGQLKARTLGGREGVATGPQRRARGQDARVQVETADLDPLVEPTLDGQEAADREDSERSGLLGRLSGWLKRKE